MPTPQLQSVNDTCLQLGIGRTKFYKLLSTGEISGVCRIGRLSAVSTNETDSGFQLTEGFGLIAVT